MLLRLPRRLELGTLSRSSKPRNLTLASPTQHWLDEQFWHVRGPPPGPALTSDPGLHCPSSQSPTQPLPSCSLPRRSFALTSKRDSSAAAWHGSFRPSAPSPPPPHIKPLILRHNPVAVHFTALLFAMAALTAPQRPLHGLRHPARGFRLREQPPAIGGASARSIPCFQILFLSCSALAAPVSLCPSDPPHTSTTFFLPGSHPNP